MTHRHPSEPALASLTNRSGVSGHFPGRGGSGLVDAPNLPVCRSPGQGTHSPSGAPIRVSHRPAPLANALRRLSSSDAEGAPKRGGQVSSPRRLPSYRGNWPRHPCGSQAPTQGPPVSGCHRRARACRQGEGLGRGVRLGQVGSLSPRLEARGDHGQGSGVGRRTDRDRTQAMP